MSHERPTPYTELAHVIANLPLLLREARRARGLSLRKAAAELGMSQSTVMRIEEGRDPHCSNCGDERGGPVGHEISECLYRSGMTVIELAATMPPDKKGRYLDAAIDAYFAREGA